ncbi:MAG: hypothetical protein ACTS3F_09075 [Phycisphaerales bacterium]
MSRGRSESGAVVGIRAAALRCVVGAAVALGAVAGAGAQQEADERAPQVRIQFQDIVIQEGEIPRVIQLDQHLRQAIDGDLVRQMQLRQRAGFGMVSTGPSRLSLLDTVPREELTVGLVLDVVGSSGMARIGGGQGDAGDGEGGHGFGDEATVEDLVAALDSADAGVRRAAALALAEFEGLDEGGLLEIIGSDGLTLEQRSRLLDVSFARFVVAPRAAVGASFQTQVPIEITQLFPQFPAGRGDSLRLGDELIELEGRSMLTRDALDQLRAEVLSREPGESVEVVVRRPFAPERLAEIEAEREAARIAEMAKARAEVEQVRARAERDGIPANLDQADPVWVAILRQITRLQAKHPELDASFEANGDVMFAGQLLGNVQHAMRAVPNEKDIEAAEEATIEDVMTPGETLTVRVPLGNLADLRSAGPGTGPMMSDLHNAWKRRLARAGVEVDRVTSELVPLKTPEYGWAAATVGQRETTLVSAARTPRQGHEGTFGLQPLQERGAFVVNNWQRGRVWNDERGWVDPDGVPGFARDRMAFRVEGPERGEPRVELRRVAAMNSAADRLGALRDQRRTIEGLLRANPAGAMSDGLRARMETIDGEIDRIRRGLAVPAGG